MKNILLGPIFILVFLPQMSFGATLSPQETACDQQLAPEWGVFWGQQGADRGTFIKANHALIIKSDRRAKWLRSHRIADNPSAVPPDLTDQEQALYTAFVAKQQSDKVAFYQKMAQEKQNCLSGTTTPTTTATPETTPTTTTTPTTVTTPTTTTPTTTTTTTPTTSPATTTGA